MLDFDVGKLVVIGVVALIVIGPKDLPRVLRQVGQVVGKMRRMANEFQSQFMDAMREADVENLKKEVESVGDAAKFDVAFDPIKDVKDQITSAVEGDVTPAAAEGDAAPDAQAGASSGSLEFDEDARALGLDEHLGELDLEEPPPPPEKLAVESLDEKLEAHDRKIEAPAQDTADAEEARPPTEKRA